MRDGCYMVLVEWCDCKDYVSIFVCSDWQFLWYFDMDIQDFIGIEWVLNGCVLVVWDICLEYKILLYLLDGWLLFVYSVYEWFLGIKFVVWSFSSQFLVVGSYDGKVCIFNYVIWKMIMEFGYFVIINNFKIVVYKEVEKSL